MTTNRAISLLNGLRFSKVAAVFVFAVMAFMTPSTQAIWIDFDSGYKNTTIPDPILDPNQDLLDQPVSGTKWQELSGRTGLTVTPGAGDTGVDGFGDQALVSYGTTVYPYGNAYYKFSPSNADLGMVFNGSSSILYYSFKRAVLEEVGENGTPVCTFGIGTTWDNYAVSLVWFGDGRMKYWHGVGGWDQLYSDTTYVVDANGDEWSSVPQGGWGTAQGFVTVSGTINYAAKTFTLIVDGVPQNSGNPIPFQNAGANKADIEIANHNGDSGNYRRYAFDDIYLGAVPPQLSPKGVYIENYSNYTTGWLLARRWTVGENNWGLLYANEGYGIQGYGSGYRGITIVDDGINPRYLGRLSGTEPYVVPFRTPDSPSMNNPYKGWAGGLAEALGRKAGKAIVELTEVEEDGSLSFSLGRMNGLSVSENNWQHALSFTSQGRPGLPQYFAVQDVNIADGTTPQGSGQVVDVRFEIEWKDTTGTVDAAWKLHTDPNWIRPAAWKGIELSPYQTEVQHPSGWTSWGGSLESETLFEALGFVNILAYSVAEKYVENFDAYVPGLKLATRTDASDELYVPTNGFHITKDGTGEKYVQAVDSGSDNISDSVVAGGTSSLVTLLKEQQYEEITIPITMHDGKIVYELTESEGSGGIVEFGAGAMDGDTWQQVFSFRSATSSETTFSVNGINIADGGTPQGTTSSVDIQFEITWAGTTGTLSAFWKLNGSTTWNAPASWQGIALAPAALVDSPSKWTSWRAILKNPSSSSISHVSAYSLKTCAEAIADGVSLTGDINQDCFVDFKDMGDFVQEWLDCTDPQNPACN